MATNNHSYTVSEHSFQPERFRLKHPYKTFGCEGKSLAAEYTIAVGIQ